jgi:hypothetical protein
MAQTRRKQRKERKQLKKRKQTKRGGGLSDSLPNTTWGAWASYPGALAWSSATQAPPALANGGLFTGAQSTGAWASHPMPATQYAMAVESAKAAGNPDVFYQQRPNDNTGASFSPYVGSPASSQHYSATMGPKLSGGRRKYRNRM